MNGRGKKLSTTKSEENITKSIRNLFILKKGNTEINDKIIRDITLFEQEGDYYRPIRVDNIWNNNYIENG